MLDEVGTTIPSRKAKKNINGTIKKQRKKVSVGEQTIFAKKNVWGIFHEPYETPNHCFWLIFHKKQRSNSGAQINVG